jgi:hypothetical protein
MQRTPEDGFAGLIYGRGLGVALPSGGFLFYAALRFFEIARVLMHLDYFVVAVWRAKEAESQPT